MKYLFLIFLCTSSLTHAQFFPNLGGQRVGISSFQFLKIGAGARGVALGETFVAIANDVSATYWNPAGLTQFSGNQFMVSHTLYVVDIQHEYLTAAYHLSPTDALGFSITSLHMPEMEETTELQPFGTGRYFRFGDIALGVSYSRKMTDQFSFGLTVRYAEETLDMLKMSGVMVDLGTYYWTGLGSSRFAVVVSNFGPDVSPTGSVTLLNNQQVSSFQAFSPPTQFKIGFAMEPVTMENQRITTTFELQHPNDNSENLHLGIEYNWNNWFSLRTGVRRTIGEPLFGSDNTNSSDITFGAGVSAPLSFGNVNVDYAFANFNMLGSVHRISLELTL